MLDIISVVIEKKSNEDGWADLALLGAPLIDAGINYKALGYLKLKQLLEEYPDSIELKIDTSHKVPVSYARLRNSSIGKSSIPQANNAPIKKEQNKFLSLRQWAYMPNFREDINDLQSIALKEIWHYKFQDPEYPFPILSSYLIYTFHRLLKENKVRHNSQFASFNTGLVNNLYEPIYALFEKNKNPGRQDWYFLDFCLSGCGRSGKLLASQFNPLPERAQFFERASDLIYDIGAPKPSLDWDHIILDNVKRLPPDFLQDHKPADFCLKDPSKMDTAQAASYFASLAEAIENNSKVFRNVKNRLSDALDLALKRVQWNYKTAIPMYYPTKNRISILLPLALVDDEHIDLALVVEKSQSGNYLGHTILPLAWAYSNARLIARPDSDWLIPDKISIVSDGEPELEEEGNDQ